AAAAGKPVILSPDWRNESNFSATGWSEAAADSIFAALAELNGDTGQKLFNSPMHFIGHSRGTSVNSEIIQRLGKYFPGIPEVQMTTLDPHDFNQPSLNLTIGEIALAAASLG